MHENFDTIRRAANALGSDTEADLLTAVLARAAEEVLRCLDPRHGTTYEQAVAAVFDASPFREALAHAKAVLA